MNQSSLLEYSVNSAPRIVQPVTLVTVLAWIKPLGLKLKFRPDI